VVARIWFPCVPCMAEHVFIDLFDLIHEVFLWCLFADDNSSVKICKRSVFLHIVAKTYDCPFILCSLHVVSEIVDYSCSYLAPACDDIASDRLDQKK
jgi:hypothetical protein